MVANSCSFSFETHQDVSGLVTARHSAPFMRCFGLCFGETKAIVRGGMVFGVRDRCVKWCGKTRSEKRYLYRLLRPWRTRVLRASSFTFRESQICREMERQVIELIVRASHVDFRAAKHAPWSILCVTSDERAITEAVLCF